MYKKKTAVSGSYLDKIWKSHHYKGICILKLLKLILFTLFFRKWNIFPNIPQNISWNLKKKKTARLFLVHAPRRSYTSLWIVSRQLNCGLVVVQNKHIITRNICHEILFFINFNGGRAPKTRTARLGGN